MECTHGTHRRWAWDAHMERTGGGQHRGACVQRSCLGSAWARGQLMIDFLRARISGARLQLDPGGGPWPWRLSLDLREEGVLATTQAAGTQASAHCAA